MKARQIIGGAIAIIGLVLAVGTADNSAHELVIRGVGVAMLATGAYIAKMFDLQNSKP